MDLNTLIKSGFPRRQANSLVAAISDAGPSDALVMRQGLDQGPSTFNWDTVPTGDTTNVNWVFSNVLWPNLVTERASDAFTFDEDGYFAGYAKAGCYLQSVTMNFEPDTGYNGAATPGLTYVKIEDGWDLTSQRFERSVSQFPPVVNFTWMSLYSAGDYNTIPQIAGLSSRVALRLKTAVYTSVRLLA